MATPFPDGKTVAVITSWDDGKRNDKNMAYMLDKYGYRGTFYICPEQIGTEGHLDEAALKAIQEAGHEIGSHSLNHPRLGLLSSEEVTKQLTESKAQIEAMFGKEVRSFAYPYGLPAGEDWVADLTRTAGYTSARTTESIEIMTVEKLRSGDLFRLPVTSYFSDDFGSVQSKWSEVEELEGGIFHFWGHSSELSDNVKEWVDFECILGFIGGISNVWYCTVGELIAVVTNGA